MPNGPNKTAQQDKTGSHDPTQPLTLLKSPGYHLTTYQSHTSSQHIGQAPAPLLRAPPHPERFRTSVLRYLATTPPTTLDILVSPRCLVGQPGAAIAQVRLPADQLNPGPCGVPGFSAPTSRKGTCRRTRCRRGCPPRQAPPRYQRGRARLRSPYGHPTWQAGRVNADEGHRFRRPAQDGQGVQFKTG
jgi:hypothetical protein